jgi:hypothetical protein
MGGTNAWCGFVGYSLMVVGLPVSLGEGVVG